jgi:sugar phosphate isomerase/epimerase
MIESAITISLVEQARGGPFVYWDGLADGCARAKAAGFDAVEIFTPAADAVDSDELRTLLGDNGLKLAAVGTGAGWVIHKRQLCDPDAAKRSEAKDFIRGIIDFAGGFERPAIIGSMQGRHGDGVDKDTALGYLAEALEELGEYAKQYNTILLYEPLNRYESNLVNTQGDGAALLDKLSTQNVKLLSDLFHMNIEEVTIAQGLRDGGKHVGHLHFVDSNRRPTGNGHMDYDQIAAALKDISFAGYACAEALPYPDSDGAAAATIQAFNKYLAPLNA